MTKYDYRIQTYNLTKLSYILYQWFMIQFVPQVYRNCMLNLWNIVLGIPASSRADLIVDLIRFDLCSA